MENSPYGGLFIKASIPMEKAKVYLLGGYSLSTLKVNTATGNGFTNVAGTGYGIGVELYGNKDTALYLENMRYISDSKFTITDASLTDQKYRLSTLTVGISHHF